jgi:hypothetical protein
MSLRNRSSVSPGARSFSVNQSIRKTAFAMPLATPAFPPGPYRFINRECFIIQYRSDPEKLRRIVPEPLELAEAVVNCEFIHLIYQTKLHETHSRDYEFGLSAMRAHWQSGLDDIRRTLVDPRRLDPPAPEFGIVTHDVHRGD